MWRSKTPRHRLRERERERDEIWNQATFQGAMSFQALVCVSGNIRHKGYLRTLA